MKQIKPILHLIFLIVFTASCQVSQKSNLTLLSNQVPTDTALVFGQGIVSIDNAMDFAITFSPEMDEMYFTRRVPGERNNIYSMKLVDDSWTTPQLAFFSSNETWEFEPHIDPKGNRLYFGSTRAINDTIKPGLIQWYSEKTDNIWSEPIPLEEPSAETFMMYLTSSQNGNLYFTSGEKGAKPEDGGIYYAIRKEGTYSQIQRMGKEINNGKMIAHSYIAPDESYMIFDGERPLGFGDSDLYISFNRNGSWTEAYNLGSKINTDQNEMAASVSPDGKYLFFHRGYELKEEGKDSKWLGNIYWIEFETIKEEIIKNSSKINSKELEIEFNEETHSFTEIEKQHTRNIIKDSENEVRKLLPTLPTGIKVIVEIVNWDLDMVGGVTGRAETNLPPVVMIQISKKFPGGLVSAMQKGLRSTIYHEFHHLALGWAIQDNKFTVDIKTAAVIEGLADVFSEVYTGNVFEENQMPENINAEDWVNEILVLPKDADYHTWMFQHPDGRTSIGYRTGNYLIKMAMANSGKTILELSGISPEELLRLAGY